MAVETEGVADLAAMVAGLAYHKYKRGAVSDMKLSAEPNARWIVPRSSR